MQSMWEPANVPRMVSPANHAVFEFFVRLKEGSTTDFGAPDPVDANRVVLITAPNFTAPSNKAQNVLNLAESPPVQ
jgi:hypothetical protein